VRCPKKGPEFEARGRDFAIEKVENLDRRFTLDTIVKNDIIDK
jgi:hypothetical protein